MKAKAVREEADTQRQMSAKSRHAAGTKPTSCSTGSKEAGRSKISGRRKKVTGMYILIL